MKLLKIWIWPSAFAAVSAILSWSLDRSGAADRQLDFSSFLQDDMT